MKTEIFYAILIAAVIIIAWVAGSYFVNRSEKRDQQRKTTRNYRDLN